MPLRTTSGKLQGGQQRKPEYLASGKGKWEPERREAAGCAAQNINKSKAASGLQAGNMKKQAAAAATENTNKRQAAGRAAENATVWKLLVRKLWQLWSERRENRMEAVGTAADARKEGQAKQKMG